MAGPKERNEFANEAFKATEHPIVKATMDELLKNLHLKGQLLPEYGVHKVAVVAAQVARAEALGIDPDLLRLTNEHLDLYQPLDFSNVKCITCDGTGTLHDDEGGTSVCPQCDKGILDEEMIHFWVITLQASGFTVHGTA